MTLAAIRKAERQVVRELLLDLESDGVDLGTQDGERLLYNALGQTHPLGRRCACGTALRIFEALNGKCERCRAAEERRVAENRARPSDLDKADVPERYLGMSLGAWRGEFPADLLEWATTNPTGFVLIHGPVGCGKTHAAMIVLRAACDGRRTVRFAAARLLPRLLLDDSRVDGRPEWSRHSRCGLLLLDDLGAETERGAATDILAELIEERYVHRRPTIVTTNLSPEDLYALDARMGSRLVSDRVVALTGDDRRIAG